MPLVSWARLNADHLLAPLGNRWRHVQQVAQKARQVAIAVPPTDRDLLVAAAYLHDIGYAPELAKTGFHPLDGARWVRDNRENRRLAGLVAYHSSAFFEARTRGLEDTLIAEFHMEESAISDALTYCDMTTGPTGDPVSLPQRIAEVNLRYGSDHAVTKALTASTPYITACHDRTLARIATAS